MHYAEFGEDEVGHFLTWMRLISLRGHVLTTMKTKSAALLAAIKEYDSNKWKVIGQKVGKPAKVGPGCPFLYPPAVSWVTVPADRF